jgi:hypothetical protein
MIYDHEGSFSLSEILLDIHGIAKNPATVGVVFLEAKSPKNYRNIFFLQELKQEYLHRKSPKRYPGFFSKKPHSIFAYIENGLTPVLIQNKNF